MTILLAHTCHTPPACLFSATCPLQLLRPSPPPAQSGERGVMLCCGNLLTSPPGPGICLVSILKDPPDALPPGLSLLQPHGAPAVVYTSQCLPNTVLRSLDLLFPPPPWALDQRLWVEPDLSSCEEDGLEADDPPDGDALVGDEASDSNSGSSEFAGSTTSSEIAGSTASSGSEESARLLPPGDACPCRGSLCPWGFWSPHLLCSPNSLLYPTPATRRGAGFRAHAV